MTVNLLATAFEWPHATALSVFFICVAAIACMFIWGLTK